MRKFGTKLLTGCLTVGMLFTFNMPAQAAQSDIGQNITATTSGISVKSWRQLEYQLQEIANGQTAGHTIVLDDDIMVGDGNYATDQDYSVTVKASKNGGDIVLDLNGHTVKLGRSIQNANTATKYLFDVYPDTKFVITNSDQSKNVDSCYIREYTGSNYSSMIHLNVAASLETLNNLKLRVDGTNTVDEASVISGYTENRGGAKEITILGTKLVIEGGKKNECTIFNVASSTDQHVPIVIGGGSFVYAPDQSILFVRDSAACLKLYDCELDVVSAKPFIHYNTDYHQSLTLNNLLADPKAKATDGKNDKNKDLDVSSLNNYLCVSGTSLNEAVQKINSTTGHFSVSGSKNVSYTPHTLDVKSEEAATCTKKGVRTSQCTDCGLTFTEEIGKLDHEFTEVEKKEPTCSEEGNKAYCYCSVCKLYYFPENRNELGFGYSVFKLDKVPHVVEAMPAVEATCSKAGIKAHYLCKECHAYYSSDSEGKNEVSVDSLIISKLEHDWDDGEITKPAEIGKEGEKTYKCKKCTETKTEKIDALKDEAKPDDTKQEDKTTEVQNTEAPKKDDKITDDQTKAVYQVTNADVAKGEVSYTSSTDADATAVEVPATVTINNVTYKVTKIADNAFKDNKKITKVTLSDDVITIGKNAFSGCTKLKTVTIGKNVTTIDNKAFYKCTSLTKIIIPASVTKIGKSAFEGCKKLKKVTIKTTKLTSKKVGSKSFKGINAKAKVKVPKAKLNAYKKILKKKGISGKKQKITK